MRDFKALVREHLSSLALPRQRELKIVDELAAQLEDAYDSLVAEGRSDEDAWIELQRQIPDWETIGAELLEAEPLIIRYGQADRGSRTGVTKRRLLAGLWRIIGLGLVRDLQ